MDNEKKPKKATVIDAKEVQKIKDKKKKELDEVDITFFSLKLITFYATPVKATHELGGFQGIR